MRYYQFVIARRARKGDFFWGIEKSAKEGLGSYGGKKVIIGKKEKLRDKVKYV